MATTQSTPSDPESRIPIQHLREDNLLWYKYHVFLYDLRNFRSNKPSSDRLNLVTEIDYLGLPYFTTPEANQIRNAIVNEKTGQTLGDVLREFFESKLEKRLHDRMKAMNDYRVCAAHDLAPIFERAVRVSANDLAKNKQFTRLVHKRGLEALDDGTVWKGMGRR